jgi:ABC-type transport system substrate-binding protein
LAACSGLSGSGGRESAPSALRIGVGAFSTTSAISGLRQVTQLVSVEGLGRLLPDGRVEPWLADRWKLSDGGRSLIVSLKPHAVFHDGLPVNAASVVALLADPLRSTMGPLADDVEQVRAIDALSFEIRFKRPSPFLLEALEVQVKKPGPSIVSTGPFTAVPPGSTTDLRANETYYAGKPAIGEIVLQTFPSVRSAWAELLRNNLDMLYDVGLDALDSLQSATSIAVFTYTRHYQFIVVLNGKVPALRPAAIRQALNLAVDRNALVQQALRDHAVPSTGVVSPAYWARSNAIPALQFDPQRAAALLGPAHVKFTCLIPPDETFERIALELKRQFSAVGVEVNFRTAPPDEIFKAEETGNFDAILIETISGPTLLRPYQAWHSKGAVNVGGAFGNQTVDAAFEKARFAVNEADYRRAVAGVEQAFIDDPPAIFLAWGKRARAISKRFEVPPAAPGRDILATLRAWKPRNDDRLANRN